MFLAISVNCLEFLANLCNKNTVKKFIIKLLILTLFMAFLLYVMTILVDSGLRKTEHSSWNVWNDILTRKAECDVYIQGSSKAWVAVSPKIIESATAKKVYNFGIEGYPLDVQLGRYKLYRRYNKKPMTIIQMLDGGSLEQRKDLFEKEQFLPYYDEECIIESINTLKGFNKIGYQLPFFKYMGEANSCMIGILEALNITHEKFDGYKGYLGQKRTWNDDFEKFVKEHPHGIIFDISAKILNDFEKFILKCKAENIEIIMIYAPEYYEVNNYFKNKPEVIEVYKSLSTKYQIEFYDFSDSYLSKDKKYFYNSQHLNKCGSELFTEEIVKIFKNKTIAQ